METQETAIYVRPKNCRFDLSDLPVIQNLISLGYDESDIGMILGYQGSNWKISAGQTCEEYKDAIDAGIKAADANLVKELEQAAFGYEYEEVTTTYEAVNKLDPMTGEVSTDFVPKSQKKTIKKVPPNAKLFELLVTNRLPDLFKKVSEVKKSSLNLDLEGEATEKQIEGLIGRLLEVVTKTKTIDSEIVDNAN